LFLITFFGPFQFQSRLGTRVVPSWYQLGTGLVPSWYQPKQLA